jgi:hypothetical protein
MYLWHYGICYVMSANTKKNEPTFELDLIDEEIIIPRGNGKGSIRVVLYGPVARKVYTRKTYANGRVEFIPIEIGETKSDDASDIERLVSIGITKKDAKRIRRTG